MRDEELLSKLSLYAPASSGSFEMIYDLTVQSAEQLFPLLLEFMRITNRAEPMSVQTTQFDDSDSALSAATKLGELFNHYGSDKMNPHEYHHVYGSILKHPDEIKSVLEIGLGTNNEDVASNMSANGKPGASIRAFRDFLPHAMVFGADVDARILFEEPRIKTYFVDQTKPETFEVLAEQIGVADFDLIIDDGLHSPNANLTTMNFALPRLKKGGFFVVEDFFSQHYPFWRVLDCLMPKDQYHCRIVDAPRGLMYVVQRIY